MTLPRKLASQGGNAWDSKFFPLKGTLNLVSPAIETPSGDCIAGLNYEASPRGYQRIDGIERYDGRPKPSEQNYWVLPFDTMSAAISAGQLVTGQTSGATGLVVTVEINDDEITDYGSIADAATTSTDYGSIA